MPRFKVLITSDVHLAVCRCGEVILWGWAEGSRTVVDPWPADRLTEITALLADRWTYTLINFQLNRRTGSTPHGPVMIEHRCGLVLTAPAITAHPSVVDLDGPPF